MVIHVVRPGDSLYRIAQLHSIPLPFLIQLWMYATPIIYPASQVPANWRWVILYNPMSWAIEGTRWALAGRGTFALDQVAVGGALAVAVLGLGLMAFNRVQRTFIDVI